jgi:hypothetical protein
VSVFFNIRVLWKPDLMSRVLFFAPEAYVVQHFAASLVVAKTLQDMGHEVYAVHCGGAFSRCTAMDAVSMPADAGPEVRQNLCRTCSAISLHGIGRYGLRALNLRSIQQQATEPAPAVGLDYEHDGVKLGLMAGQGVVLLRKLADLKNLTPEDAALLSDSARGCREVYDAVKLIAQQLRIDYIVAYNEYGYNVAAFAAGDKLGVRWKVLYQISHRNVDRRWVSMADVLWRPMSHEFQAAWRAWRDAPLTPGFIDEVAEDVFSRLAAPGSHVYSPAKTTEGGLRARLGIPANKRLAVAFTSGRDEAAAHNALAEATGSPLPACDLFADQVDWLTALAGAFSGWDDACLVIRIHPREAANKRDGVTSEHLQQLKEALVDLPPNVQVVWPQDKVSSYDLIEASDLTLIAWSTIGLEAARLGTPVIAAFKNNHVYPDDHFVQCAGDREAYFVAVRDTLTRNDSVSVSDILAAFRWHVLTRFARSVFLGDVFRDPDAASFPDYVLSEEAAAIETSLLDCRALERRRLVEAQKRSDVAGRSAETERLLHQLRRIVHFLMTGEITVDPLFLEFHCGAVRMRSFGPGEFALVVNADEVSCRYLGAGVDIVRESPMVRRLAEICAQMRFHGSESRLAAT